MINGVDMKNDLEAAAAVIPPRRPRFLPRFTVVVLARRRAIEIFELITLDV